MAARLIRTAEAARALGVAGATLWRWEKAGITRTVGGQARWDLDDLREQIRKLNQDGTRGDPTA